MHIVIIDDDAANVAYLRRVLRNYSTESFVNPKEALDYCLHNSFDLIVADQKMPSLSGIELIKRIREQKQNTFYSIIISAYTDTDDLIDAVNSNLIYKYIVKPFTPDFLLQNIYRTEEALNLYREKAELEEQLHTQNETLIQENALLRSHAVVSFDSFIGYNHSIEKVKEMAKMYAQSNNPVLLSGETGTGKDLLAKAIHDLSPRSKNQFIPINCSAFSENLIESELFGYEKGAFTGAIRNKQGLVEAAAHGTLFLDEIGDFDLNFQAKILRFIQFGTFFPLGSVKEKKVDVRIIAATNKDLNRAVQSEAFRKDLFYRLNALHIEIPPLRERREDIIPILNFIAGKKSYRLPVFTDNAIEWLNNYSFPGNVREIEGFLEKLHLHCLMHRTESVDETLTQEIMTNGHGKKSVNALMGGIQDLHLDTALRPDRPLDLQSYLDEVQKKIISHYLEYHKWNISRTADALHLSRQGLKNKINKLDLHPR